MKNLTLILLTICMCSCIGTGSETQTENDLKASLMKSQSDTANPFNIPEVDSLFEFLDKKKYSRRHNGEIDHWDQTDEYSLTVREHEDMIVLNLYTSDSPFFTSKVYYKSGMIKVKGVFFNNGPFQKGKWYYFDEQGNFTRSKDFDAIYKFSFEDLYELFKEKDITLANGVPKNNLHTKIFQIEAKNGDPLWLVEWFKEPGLLGTMTIDGKTGEILEIRDMTYEW